VRRGEQNVRPAIGVSRAPRDGTAGQPENSPRCQPTKVRGSGPTVRASIARGS
jgi:hypothetical protein